MSYESVSGLSPKVRIRVRLRIRVGVKVTGVFIYIKVKYLTHDLLLVPAAKRGNSLGLPRVFFFFKFCVEVFSHFM